MIFQNYYEIIPKHNEIIPKLNKSYKFRLNRNINKVYFQFLKQMFIYYLCDWRRSMFIHKNLDEFPKIFSAVNYVVASNTLNLMF